MAHQRIPAIHKHGSEKPGNPSDEMALDGFADILPFRSPGDLQSVLTKIAELARVLTGASGAAIAFKSDEGTICRARSGEDGPILGAPVNTSTGISKQCLDTGTPQRSDDVRKDDRVDRQVSQAIGIRAIAVVPIFQNGLISGILAVFSRTPGTFTDRHLKMMEHLASLVESPTSLVLQNSSPAPAEPAPSIANESASNAGIKLLVEPESAYRVFFHNLADLTSRPASPLPTTSKLDYGWNHVLIESPLPWKRFFQSVGLHLAVIAIGLGLGEIWPRELTVPTRPIRPSQITYYPAAEAYPSTPRKFAAGAKRRSQPTLQKRQQAAIQQSRDVLKVPRGKGSLRPEPTNAAAPNLALAQNQKLALGGSALLPAPPVAGGSQSRRIGLPGDAVVAPAPEIGGGNGSRRLTAPGATIVPPSPDVAAAMRSGGSRLGGGMGGDANAAVPPAPEINGRQGLTYHSGSGLTSQGGVQVVGPPPSLQAGTVGGRGNAVSLGPGGQNVVPPPASLEGNGSSAGKGRGNAIVGGPNVVPPPPSEVSPGQYGAGGRLGSISGTGTQVVPPAPTVQGTGGAGLGLGRMGSLAGNGSEVAGPPPSIEGGSNSLGGDRGSAVGQLGPQVGPPGAAQSGSGEGPLSAGSTNKADAQKPKIAEKQTPPAQDVQLRLISVAWSPPRSSYFSNYEVFIAEKWTNKQPQLIKLVYVFLPYQRRLSEYGSDAKVRKLRVTRDRSCDESLMQMEWADDKSPAGTNQSNNAAEPADRNNKLPCYRTTADDYRRAVTGTR